MLRIEATDELNAEPPERRRDHFPEAPEAEHPAYPRYFAKTATLPVRHPSAPTHTRRVPRP